MNLFGTKKAAPAPRIGDSINMLKEAQLTLEKREKHLEKQVALTREAAKEKVKAKDKRGAIHLLKKCKMLETQIEQGYGKKANIDVQIMALESAASNKEIFDVMRAGTVALKAATAHTDVDRVSDMMEDMTEQIQMADEVNVQMAQPIGPQMDEDELQAELDSMEQELKAETDHAEMAKMDAQLMAAPPVPSPKAQEIAAPAPVQQQAAPAAAAARATPAAAPQQRQVVMAGGAPAPASSSSGSGAKKLSEKEQREMKELEALMGM